MNENKDEILKNQLVGWGVALPTIALASAAGGGMFSVLLGAIAAVSVMLWRIKKNEQKEAAK